MLIKSFLHPICSAVTLIVAVLYHFEVFAVEHNRVETGEINFASYPIVIDGKRSEKEWSKAPWFPLNHHILGEMPNERDFSGQFKLLWDQDYLYILAEITDDILFDQHPDPLFKYWDDDCLEIFIDEDNSGGEHEFNFNAFAYHIALDNQAVDIGPKQGDNPPFILLNEHITSKWKRDSDSDNKITWEVSVKLFDDKFALGDTQQKAVKLTQDKEIGFMLAYCDNDGSLEREHFLGSVPIVPINGDKNLGYKTADVFQTFILKR